MIPLNEMEAKVAAEVVVAAGWVRSLLRPALYVFIGICFGVAFTIIAGH